MNRRIRCQIGWHDPILGELSGRWGCRYCDDMWWVHPGFHIESRLSLLVCVVVVLAIGILIGGLI